jgi:hypothetical protein
VIAAVPFTGIVSSVVPDVLAVLIGTFTASMTPVGSRLCRDRMALH